jgi:pimeloyl-ACP methyl ester carboxylesterase
LYNRHLINRGLNVLVLSYQGFDGNDGDADIGSLYGDLRAFYDYSRRRFPHQPIGLMAESVSTSPFFCFASSHPEIKALAVEAMVNLKTAPFAKVNDWWLFYPLYPVTLAAACLVSAGVPQDLNVQKALQHSHEVPILFLHHPQDRVTPFRIARRIFNRYHGPKQWITLQKDLLWENHMTASYEAGTSAEILRFFKAHLQDTSEL